MYISLWENSRGHPDNVSFMQFSTKIDGFEQKDSQGFENLYNSYEQYPLEKFFIFTIYQNYTLALIFIRLVRNILHREMLCKSLKALFNNVFTLKKIWAAWPYMQSVSLVRCKNEALKKLYFKSIIKCFKRVKIDKWPDSPYSFSPIDYCVRINGEPDCLFSGDIQS